MVGSLNHSRNRQAMSTIWMKQVMLILASLALASCHVAAEAGRMRVIDGDTLEIKSEKFRLWGIDAPELRQRCEREGKAYACGAKAREALSRLIGNQEVTCKEVNRDRYQRTVARCAANGEDLAALLVRSGWALDYRRYSNGRYAKDQAVAKRKGAGLWAGKFKPPWIWRSNKRRR